jgi:hypothetical protein
MGRVRDNSKFPSPWDFISMFLIYDSALLTHLYQYFGLLLGCSTVGQTGFPKYGGETSMYSVHK